MWRRGSAPETGVASEVAVEIRPAGKGPEQVLARGRRVNPSHASGRGIVRAEDGLGHGQPEQLPLDVVETVVDAEVQPARAVFELSLRERADDARGGVAGSAVR